MESRKRVARNGGITEAVSAELLKTWADLVPEPIDRDRGAEEIRKLARNSGGRVPPRSACP